MNKREVGSIKEEIAAAYLQGEKVRIVERNFRNRTGEIDLIGYHQGYLVFFEVKYRKNVSHGTPQEAVSIAKQRKICKVAEFYRYCHRVALDTPIRYDVIAITGEQVEWVKNAFEHIY